MKKVVILESNPRKDLNLNIEIKNLENIIESSWKPDQPSQIKVVKAALAVKPNELQGIMLKYEPQIVHFCGHGTGQQGLVFQNDRGDEQLASTDALANFFELVKDTVECIVLNACYSEVQANEIVKHINYVVGMNQAIQDNSAIAFATGFYQALAFGESIEKSFKFGCSAIQFQNSPQIISRIRSTPSDEERKLILVNAETEINSQYIPGHLIPILFEKNDVYPSSSNETQTLSPLEQDIQIDIAQSIKSISEADALQEYRKKVQDFFKQERRVLDTAQDLIQVDRFLDTPSLPPAKKARLEEEARKIHVLKGDARKIIKEEEERIQLAQKKYKQTVHKIIYDNKSEDIPLSTQDDLNSLQKTLELSNAEAFQIRKVVTDEYYKYKQALQNYKNLLTKLVETQYPLSEEMEIELNQFQENNNLKLKDIEIIKNPIIDQANNTYREVIEQYDYRVERYKQEFIFKIKARNPLNEDDFHLKQVQLDCNLSNEDRTRIEKSAIAEQYKQEFLLKIQAHYLLNEYDFLDLKRFQLDYNLSDEDKDCLEKSAVFDSSLIVELKDLKVAILALAFDRDRQILISSGGDISFNFFIPNIISNTNNNVIELWNIYNEQLPTQISINRQSNIIHNLLGRTGVINSVTFSNLNPYYEDILASGSSDKTIKLWSVRRQQEIRTLSGHVKAVNSFAFNRFGDILASGSSDKTIKLWRVGNGEEICTLSGHSNIVHSVVFSPDGQLLASGSGDNTIKLWDVNKEKEIYTLNGHSNVVRSVAFSLDGKILASGSSDGTVKLWKIWNGKEIRTLFEHSAQIISIAFSPDGEILASGSSDGTIKLWDIRNNEELLTLFAHSDWVSSVVFSSNDRLISGSKDKTIKIWKIYRI